MADQVQYAIPDLTGKKYSGTEASKWAVPPLAGTAGSDVWANGTKKTDTEKTLESAFDFDLLYGKNSGQSPTQAAVNVVEEASGWASKYLANIAVVVVGVVFVVLAFFVSDLGKNLPSGVIKK